MYNKIGDIYTYTPENRQGIILKTEQNLFYLDFYACFWRTAWIDCDSFSDKSDIYHLYTEIFRELT